MPSSPEARVATSRRNLMLGTAGHVDHGKTALVRLLTGCETDTLAEEKERGLTIDLGFAPCRLSDNRVVGIVDVPGHVDFIRNMVAGAQGIDVVMLVVAADDGVMPQTREHLQILTLMGLKHGLVALTKIDLVDAGRRDEVIRDLRVLLRGTFLAEAPVCPVSNVTGEGFDAFFDALNDTVARCGDRACSGPFRLWIEDVFAIKGAGTVVTGIPSSGSVSVGDELNLLPAGARARARRLQVYGADATQARAGECVALNVPEIGLADARRGLLLADAWAPAPTSFAEARLDVLDSVRGPLGDLFECHAHIGTASVAAKVALLESSRIAPGQSQYVQLRLEEPLPLTCGERFVLRGNVSTEGQGSVVTIGGGRILGLSNKRLRRQKPWTLAGLTGRQQALDHPDAWCELVVREAGKPVAEAELPIACRLKPAELEAVLGRLLGSGRTVKMADGRWVHASLLEHTAAELLRRIGEFHAAHPQRAGLALPDLRSGLSIAPEVCEAALQRLRKDGKVEVTGGFVARAGWSARLSNPDQALCAEIAAAFQAHGCAPPDLETLSASLRQPATRVQKLVQLLIEQGTLVRVDASLVVHREAFEAARKQALRLFSVQPRFTTMQFRDALGVSRKYAVPILDLLDKLRFTVRNGHDRTPGVEARKHLPPR